jgi:hypothetical protein
MMPRYFFHIVHPNSSPVLDDEGEPFENIETARADAVASIREIAADAIKHGRKMSGLAIQIADETGKVLDTATAGDFRLGPQP